MDCSLWTFNEIRPKILAEVVEKTSQHFERAPKDLILGEALYAERLRMRKFRPNLFTRNRHKGDRALWKSVQKGLLSPPALVDRDPILKQVVEHYAQEIGAHFNPRIYVAATQMIPFLFDWLLNAASVRKFLPWKMTESVRDRLRITGEVESLMKLSKKGTVLLVPTHQSNIDSILIGYLIHQMGLPPFSYGAGLNLFSNPVLSFFMGNLGSYTVDRTKQNEIYKQCLKDYSTTILRNQVHSIFFPGGGRSKSGAIEDKLKLGLLGTALEAQIKSYQIGAEKPNIFIVPMVTSYHFVLEAGTLVDDYLVQVGKHKFIAPEEEVPTLRKVLNFFWALFTGRSQITARVGRALDVFGNFVDDEGNSIGPNGTTIDPRRWLSTRGELIADPARDREYTRELGEILSERFHRENTVLTSHLLAYAFFEVLRKQYPDLDLYRFLRLSLAQRSLPLSNFMTEASLVYQKISALADRGQLFLGEELKNTTTEAWVKDGLSNLGMFHSQAVLKSDQSAIWTEDMNLLYYYRNRLTGYGIRYSGNTHGKGFLE
jgi:glycerol-3-phosphate O-acyltransferase